MRSIAAHFCSLASRMSMRAMLIASLAAGAGSSRIDAQSSTATLGGVVIDQSSAVVAEANVTVVNVATRLQRQLETSADGAFTFPLLPPGTYTVSVQRSGFAPAEVRDLVLNVNDQVAIRVQLKVSTVDETVSVVADSGRIRTSAAVATVIDRQFVENLPLNGRTIQSLLALTPGVVFADGGVSGQFSVNGQRTNANYVTVDGVSANFSSPLGVNYTQVNGSTAAMTTAGGTNGLVSVDALQEFNVQTSSFAPEFGRSPGAQVSVVTRSGTNAYHGTAFEYFRDDALDATDWFVNRTGARKPPLEQHDAGGVLGGRIVRDRAFFFASYERLRLKLPQQQTTVVPSMDLRRAATPDYQRILNAFPVPNGRDRGTGGAELTASYFDPSETDAWSLRLDEVLGRGVTLFGRYNRSTSSTTRRSGVHLASTAQTSGIIDTTTIGMTWVGPRGLLNDLRANYSTQDGLASAYRLDDFGGAIPAPASDLFSPSGSLETEQTIYQLSSVPGTPNFRVGATANSAQRQINIVDTVTWVTGSHQWKFGLDYRRMSPRLSASNVRQFLFTPADVVAGTATIVGFSARRPAEPVLQNVSVFWQDTWQASRRLTVTYGLRWDANPALSDDVGAPAVTQVGDLKNLALAPAGTPVYRTTYDNAAPRAGLAYRLREKPGRDLILRGGVGLFNDLGNGLVTNVYNGASFASTAIYQNRSYPADPTINLPPPFVTTPPYSSFLAVDPALDLPYAIQWNIAAEQALGPTQSVTVTWLGALGRQLTQSVLYRDTYAFSPQLTVLTNGGTSDYRALQLQYERRLSGGLRALASYSWSHSIDTASSEYADVARARADSDFDIRHSGSVAVTYDVPAPSFARRILGGWSIDGIARGNSGRPQSVYAQQFIVLDGLYTDIRADLVPGVPLSIDDPAAPGGRRLNPAAFVAPLAGSQGNSDRNIVRALPFWQLDLAVRRQFALPAGLRLQLRAEAFNALNRPNFAGFDTLLTNPTFGQATQMLNRGLGASGLNPLYQMGGPRSVQLGVKVLF